MSVQMQRADSFPEVWGSTAKVAGSYDCGWQAGDGCWLAATVLLHRGLLFVVAECPHDTVADSHHGE